MRACRSHDWVDSAEPRSAAGQARCSPEISPRRSGPHSVEGLCSRAATSKSRSAVKARLLVREYALPSHEPCLVELDRVERRYFQGSFQRAHDSTEVEMHRDG